MFLFTDGCINYLGEVNSMISNCCDYDQVFPVGVGSYSVSTLEDIAKSGRGFCTFIKDKSSDINGQLVEALQRAMVPSF